LTRQSGQTLRAGTKDPEACSPDGRFFSAKLPIAGGRQPGFQFLIFSGALSTRAALECASSKIFVLFLKKPFAIF
jgi:hypothetical protein